jgi:hypothetical protein
MTEDDGGAAPTCHRRWLVQGNAVAGTQRHVDPGTRPDRRRRPGRGTRDRLMSGGDGLDRHRVRRRDLAGTAAHVDQSDPADRRPPTALRFRSAEMAAAAMIPGWPGCAVTAMISDSSPGARGTVTPWPPCADGEMTHRRQPGAHGDPWHAPARSVPNARGQAGDRAGGTNHQNEEPAVAVACAVLGGAMAAEGRFEEARHWLGRAERIFQPETEPSIGMHRIKFCGLDFGDPGFARQPGSPSAWQ